MTTIFGNLHNLIDTIKQKKESRFFMKKYIVTGLLAWALMSNNISLGMFKVLRTSQRPYARNYHIKNNFFTLREKNIFTASPAELATNAPELLEDLYDRNNNIRQHLCEEMEYAQKIVKILEQQNSVAVNHIYHEEPLNITGLKSLEDVFITEIATHLRVGKNLHQFIINHNKPKGHANE